MIEPKKQAEIDNMFESVKQRFILWLVGKPTGSFGMKIAVNQGGVRDKPSLIVEEK